MMATKLTLLSDDVVFLQEMMMRCYINKTTERRRCRNLKTVGDNEEEHEIDAMMI